MINQVEDGVPTEELIPQIDKETENMEVRAKTRLKTVVMDKKFWGDGDLVTSDDYKMQITSYEVEMRIIEDYENVRKRYAQREITRKEFLAEIRGPREFFSLHSI